MGFSNRPVAATFTPASAARIAAAVRAFEREPNDLTGHRGSPRVRSIDDYWVHVTSDVETDGYYPGVRLELQEDGTFEEQEEILVRAVGGVPSTDEQTHYRGRREFEIDGDMVYSIRVWTAIEVAEDGGEVPARITARSGYAHGWVEQEQLANGSLDDRAGGHTGNLTLNTLFEINRRTDVPLNTTVMAFPGFGWQQRVIVTTQQEGNGTVPEIHAVQVLDAGGGNFTLAYTANGSAPFSYQTTGPLAWNANATTIETALEGLSNLGNLTVSGNGTVDDPFLIEHDDDNANHQPLVADYANLVGARLWMFEYAPPGSANTTLDSLTVTSVLTSENNTILAGQVNVENATTINYEGNNTFNLGIASFYFGGTVNQTFNGTVNQTFNANLTLTLTGSFILTLNGNTTIPSNRTLTLPHIIGNDAAGKLRITSNATANASLPTALRVDNSTLELTGLTGTPPTPATGSYGLFVDDATEQLYLVDDGGTEYPVGITGSGTSAGAEGDVQFASATPGDFDFENGGPTYICRYDKTTHQLTVPGLKIIPVPSGGGTLIISALGVVSADTDGSMLVYATDNSGHWDTSSPDNVKEALDRIKAAVAGLLGTAIP